MTLSTLTTQDGEPNDLHKRGSEIALDTFNKRRKITVIVSDLPDRLASDDHEHGNSSDFSVKSPQDYLSNFLSSHGVKAGPKPFQELAGFFAEPTVNEVTAYGSDVLNAVRGRDIHQLRSFLSKGRPLKCSNQFGESLLHLACRRGFIDVVKFLVDEAAVPLRVKDDYGRTPLHDALWTSEPRVELVDFIIGRCPDLLYVIDRRGNTPLSFVRRPNWGIWVDFLKECSVEKLTPTCESLFRME